jgi:aminoglycoside phosphotransferase (APT) family kinase protein
MREWNFVGDRVWDADRPLTLETAAAVIAAAFPGVDASGLKYLGSGWEFDAFLTTDGWAFRFPRRAETGSLFESEARVHRLVTRFLPRHVTVPRVELLATPAADFPYPIAGHRFIDGVALYSVGEHLMPTLAREIATALGAMHSIPEAEALAAGVPTSEVRNEGRDYWIPHWVALASEAMSFDPIVALAIKNLTSAPSSRIRYDGPRHFIHQDLGTEHVLANPATGALVGILDWTDVSLGDAAGDFAFLVTWRGWEFAESVLRHYPCAIDPGFRDRLRFISQMLSTMWLALAVEQGSDLTYCIPPVYNAFAIRD